MRPTRAEPPRRTDLAPSHTRADLDPRPPACRAGLILVHDPEGLGKLIAGKPLPLALAAMRAAGGAEVEILVNKRVSASLRRMLGAALEGEGGAGK